MSQFLHQIAVETLFRLDASRTAGGNRDQHKVMATGPTQVVWIKYQLAHFMLVNDLETIGLRHLEAINQGVVQALGQCL